MQEKVGSVFFLDFTYTSRPPIDFKGPTHFIIFIDTKDIFRDPERFLVGRNGVAEDLFFIVRFFRLQMSVNFLVSFHAINVQLEY